MRLDMRAPVSASLAIAALVLTVPVGAQHSATSPESYTTPLSFDFPGFSGFWLQDSRPKDPSIPSVFVLHDAVRQEIPLDYMTVLFPANKARWTHTADANLTGTIIKMEHYGTGMYIMGSATDSPSSSEPMADGTYLGELKYMGVEQESKSIYFNKEWLDRGHIFECDDWPKSAVFKSYEFHLAENLTTFMNITGMGITANITTKLSPPSGPLKASRRIPVLNELGEPNGDPMLRIVGMFRPKIFNFKGSGGEVFPTRYAHLNATSFIDVAVPENTSALQVNGATGYNVVVSLTLLETGQRWENMLLPTVFNTRGSESPLWFAPLDPRQRYNLTIHAGNTVDEPFNGGDISSIDLWSFDATAPQGSASPSPSPSLSLSSSSPGHPEPTASSSVAAAAGNKSSNVAAIAGGVVGGVVGLALLALLAFFLWRRNGRSPKKNAFDILDSGDVYSAPPTPHVTAFSPIASPYSPGPDTSLPVASPQAASQTPTQYGLQVPTAAYIDRDARLLTPLTIKHDNPFISRSTTVRETIPVSATTSSSNLMSSPSSGWGPAGSGSYAASEPVPTTEVAFEEDAGQLQPIAVPSPVMASPVAILPPNYNPQWAVDAQEAAEQSRPVDSAAPVQKS